MAEHITSAELLFACIRRSVFGLEMQADEITAINEQSLKELYALSVRHDLAHLVYDGLQKSGLLPEGEVGQKLKYQKDLAFYRYIHQSAALEDICRAFEKAEIVYVPLKGAVIRDFYPEPWMRTGCDIDILVHEEDLERAIAALERKTRFRRGKGGSYHDVQLCAPNRVNLELHFHIKKEFPCVDDVLDQAWEYAASVESGMSQYRLSNEFFMFYHLAHMAAHFINGGCGLKPFLDMELLQRGLPVDQIKLEAFLEKGKLRKFADAIIPLAEVLCTEGRVEISESAKSILDYIFGGGVYGTVENVICSQQARQGGALKNLIHRMWLPYSTLVHNHYAPVGREYLKPYYEIRRWVLAISDKKRRNSWALQLKKNIAVSENERSHIKQILADLDLLKPTQ